MVKMVKPTGPRPPVTPSRSRRIVRFTLRHGSAADDIIADWINELQEHGLEHSAAIRNILRAAISGHSFVTPLRHIHYVPHQTPATAEPGSTEPEARITKSDRVLLEALRTQLRGRD